MPSQRSTDATPLPSQYVTVQEGADYTRQSVRTIRQRISDGSLPAYRVGPRAIRIRVGDLDKLMRRIPTAGC